MGGGREDHGGWDPHLHFQLTTAEPATHDMPGLVSREARRMAMVVDYPDPRNVLGNISDD